MKKRNYLFLPFLLTAFFLTACGSKSGADVETARMEDMAMAAPEAGRAVSREGAFYAPEIAENSGGGSEEAPYEMEADLEAAPITSEVIGQQMLPTGRKLIRNISMNVETDSFDSLLTGLTSDIAKLGGYIEQSDITGNRLSYSGEPIPRYAGITARIPVNHLDEFITKVELNGNVTNKSESTQDITLQYSDIESRKKSLEIEQERIWALLEKAESIDTVISLEERLSEIRYELESMESELRLYDNQVDYSTVYLEINEVTVFTPTAPETAWTRIKNGFTDNFTAFLTATTNLLIGFITTSPVWIPFLLVAGAGYLLIRKHNKKISSPLSSDKKEEEKEKKSNA